MKANVTCVQREGCTRGEACRVTERCLGAIHQRNTGHQIPQCEGGEAAAAAAPDGSQPKGSQPGADGEQSLRPGSTPGTSPDVLDAYIEKHANHELFQVLCDRFSRELRLLAGAHHDGIVIAALGTTFTSAIMAARAVGRLPQDLCDALASEVSEACNTTMEIPADLRALFNPGVRS